jgi:hypothetical protein
MFRKSKINGGRMRAKSNTKVEFKDSIWFSNQTRNKPEWPNTQGLDLSKQLTARRPLLKGCECFQRVQKHQVAGVSMTSHTS